MQDLKRFIESSEYGCVYFSLGTNVVLKTLNDGTLKTIINALALLPYNVLLKSDIDDMLGIPNNVLIRKWFPQQDILGENISQILLITIYIYHQELYF